MLKELKVKFFIHKLFIKGHQTVLESKVKSIIYFGIHKIIHESKNSCQYAKG